MALFVVDRYLGDDDGSLDAEDSFHSTHADEILKKLRKQVRIKKREKLSYSKLEENKKKQRETPPSVQDESTNKTTESKADKSKKDKTSPGVKSKNKNKEGSSGNDVHATKESSTKRKKLGEELSPKKKQKTEKKSGLEIAHRKKGSNDADDVEGSDDENLMEDNGEPQKASRKDADFGMATEGQAHAEVGGFTVIGDVEQKSAQKVNRVLPDWLAKPSVVAGDIRTEKVPLSEVEYLDEDLLQQLQDNGITHLFPVQSHLIPVLLSQSSLGHVTGLAGCYPPRDVCCSAPTGSGKTLAFALPIIQTLKKRVVCQVRALVVLPVRELAVQVHKVFQLYCKGTHLKVGLIVGQKAFVSEQRALVRTCSSGFHSLADIIVATPGRLVDHISRTPGFNLHSLRYLVIDEADRMMDEIKHDWLMQVERAVYEGDVTQGGELRLSGKINNIIRSPLGPLTAANAAKMTIPLQKLLFSATLSQNPEKLQQLNLFLPQLFTAVVSWPPTVQPVDNEKATDVVSDDHSAITSKGEFVGKYTTPSGLTEYFVQCSPGEKPLHMLYFTHRLKFRRMLCFTNSVEAAHRLFWLLKLAGGLEVREMSSHLHAMKRARILRQFAAGKIDILICSDAMARGMDIENVQYVVSYDFPPFLKTYIHRIGRTARAGRAGTTVTLLEKKEIYHFKQMTKKAGKTNITELKFKRSQLKTLLDTYEMALEQLPTVLKGEKNKIRNQ